jgi:hypothetical protein
MKWREERAERVARKVAVVVVEATCDEMVLLCGLSIRSA